MAKRRSEPVDFDDQFCGRTDDVNGFSRTCNREPGHTGRHAYKGRDIIVSWDAQ